MTIDMEKERADFEKWFRVCEIGPPRFLDMRPPYRQPAVRVFYKELSTDLMWYGWLARAGYSPHTQRGE